MKKFFFSMIAALLLIMTGASVNANAGNQMPSPKSPVDQFITLFTRMVVLDDLSSELDASINSSKVQTLEGLEEDTVDKIVNLFESNGSYVLSASEKVMLANYLDVLVCFVNNDNDSEMIAAIKSQLYSMNTMNDLYNAITSDSGEEVTTSLIYSYGDIVLNYPDHYSLTDSETQYGVHLYIQHQSSTPTSVYMEIENINTARFAALSTRELRDFLISECQSYYDKYIDSDYKVNWKTDITFYEDSDMAVMALTGIQYGKAFTGEFVCLLHGAYEITAFITGSDDAHEEEARKIFLSALE